MSQESLGSLIKGRRVELDMTQRELGKILHVSDKAIWIGYNYLYSFVKVI